MEIKKIQSQEMIKSFTDSGLKLYIFQWKEVLKNNCKLISEKIFFKLNLNIKQKSISNNDKIILLGECNDQYWFFKIFSDFKRGPYKFSIKKPSVTDIQDFTIYLIDWYSIIEEISPQEMEVEFAITDD